MGEQLTKELSQKDKLSLIEQFLIGSNISLPSARIFARFIKILNSRFKVDMPLSDLIVQNGFPAFLEDYLKDRSNDSEKAEIGKIISKMANKTGNLAQNKITYEDIYTFCVSRGWIYA